MLLIVGLLITVFKHSEVIVIMKEASETMLAKPDRDNVIVM